MKYTLNIEAAIEESNKKRFEKDLPVFKNLNDLCRELEKKKAGPSGNIYAKLYRWKSAPFCVEKHAKLINLIATVLNVDLTEFILCKIDPES